jgi:DNA mismatch repair protein MSH2
LELLRDETGFGHFKLRTFDLSQYMKLDASAVEALNLFPAASDSDKNMSLYGLLNKCRTAAGSRLLMQWYTTP